MRGRPVRYIAVLPSLITLLNGAFGFAAIVFASRPHTQAGWSSYALAACMILGAMVMDMLDGRVARMSQSTSSFGGQLDSLCDMISFGVAPAFLMLKLLESTSTVLDLANRPVVGRLIWLAGLAYMAAAAVRLARFNVENVETESDHMSFVGLPSPAAAGVIVSLVLFHQDPDWPDLQIIPRILPLVAVIVAALMVSRVRYPHVVNQYLKGKKPVSYLLNILVACVMVVVDIRAALVVFFGVFAGSGLVQAILGRIRHSHAEPVDIPLDHHSPPP